MALNGIDTLTGSDDADILVGDAGRDLLLGGLGDDTLDGGAGADTLIGSHGNDSYPVDGLDRVVERAGEGRDTLRVAAAVFALGPGHANVEDLVYVGGGSFVGSGDAGANRLAGGSGGDRLAGLAGDDELFGEGGADRLFGGLGADRLAGGDGDDTLDGGGGDDLAIFAGLRGDYLFFRTGAAALAEVRVSHRGSGEFDLLRGIERVRFGDGSVADLSFTDLLVNTASPGADVYAGGDGGDSFDGSGGRDSIAGGGGDDTLFGGAGHDSIGGDGGDDSLDGGSGNDTLDGGSGDDAMRGGTGDDVYSVDAAGDFVVELPGQGSDTLRTTRSTQVLAAGVENLVYLGAAGFAGLGNELANRIVGGPGDDSLDGAGGNDRLQGGDGADRLDGGAGADRLDGGSGDDLYLIDHRGDLIVDSGGNDTAQASVGWSLAAGIENLILAGSGNIGGSGNALANRLAGNDGDNVLNGGGGGDTLVGGGGGDSLIGGPGDDSLDGGSGDDTLDGGPGSDLAILAGLRGDYRFFRITAAAGSAVRVTDTGSGEADLLRRIERVRFADGSVAELSLADLLAGSGSGGDDHLIGADGADGFDGGGGRDTLEGGGGGDTLSGGAGADTLDGGAGPDWLDGGAGDDFYRVDDAGDSVSDSGGNDTVSAAIGWTLGAGIENLRLEGPSLLFDPIAYSADSRNIDGRGNELANRLVGNDGDNSLDGGDGNDLLLGQYGDDVLIGGGGADSLDGGPGGDSLDGGAGDDSLVGGSFIGENDTVAGGDGNDSLRGEGGILDGGTGNDTLNGGLMRGGDGADVFVFDDSLLRTPIDFIDETGAVVPLGVAIPRIEDFAAGDRLLLDAGIFAALAAPGVDLAGALAFGSVQWDAFTGIGQNLASLLAYDNATGLLLYDPDGAIPVATSRAVVRIMFDGAPVATLGAADLFVG